MLERNYQKNIDDAQRNWMSEISGLREEAASLMAKTKAQSELIAGQERIIYHIKEEMSAKLSK